VEDDGGSLLADTDRAIVAYVRTLTRTPAMIAARDVARLQECGLTAREIYDVASIAALFGYLNRIALGLGVPLEQNWKELQGDLTPHR
jgi:uncharacterized protein YciW